MDATVDEIHDDNKDIIEDDVRETNVRTFMEVTDIAKIVRKNIHFWNLQMKTCEVMAARNDSDDVGNSQSRTCEECEKILFFFQFYR